jgi:hypothetical protein
MMAERIRNSAADSEIGMRRSGGSHGDPHGGHNNIDNEWRTPEADPAHELVPAGAGELPPGDKGKAAEARTSFEQPVEGAENKLRINKQTHLPEITTPNGS